MSTSLYGGDHSSADLALCRYLAFYANGDYYTVDTLFRQSGLYREKWDQRRGNTTYGTTIAKAIADYSDGLQATSINLEKVEDFEVKKIDGNNKYI